MTKPKAPGPDDVVRSMVVTVQYKGDRFPTDINMGRCSPHRALRSLASHRHTWEGATVLRITVGGREVTGWDQPS